MVADVNAILRGWFAYFQHSSYRNVFHDQDRWVRGRMRGILRRRSGRCGPGGGYDNIRWPNDFFAELGLFSLVEARAAAAQPSRR